MKMGDSNVTVLIFESGKATLTGLKSVEQGRKIAREVALKLFKAGLKKDLRAPTGFSVSNVVGSVDFGHQIDLVALSSHLKTDFNPELFSSATTYRLPMPTAEDTKRKLAFNFFRNGKANILGGKSEEQMLEGVEIMKKKLQEFLLQYRSTSSQPKEPETVQELPIPQSPQFWDVEPQFPSETPYDFDQSLDFDAFDAFYPTMPF